MRYMPNHVLSNWRRFYTFRLLGMLQTRCLCYKRDAYSWLNNADARDTSGFHHADRRLPPNVAMQDTCFGLSTCGVVLLAVVTV